MQTSGSSWDSGGPSPALGALWDSRVESVLEVFEGQVAAPQPRKSIKAHRQGPRESDSLFKRPLDPPPLDPDSLNSGDRSSRIPTAGSQVEQELEVGQPASWKGLHMSPRVVLKRVVVPKQTKEEEKEEEEEEEQEEEEESEEEEEEPKPVAAQGSLPVKQLKGLIPEQKTGGERKLKVLDVKAQRKLTQDVSGKGLSCGQLCVYFIPLLLLLGGCSWYVWYHGDLVLSFQLSEGISQTVNYLQGLWQQQEETCSANCSFILVESIPVGLSYPVEAPRNPSIYHAWMELLAQVNSSVDIAAFYWTLQNNREQEGVLPGRHVFEKFLEVLSRGVELNLAVNSQQPCGDEDTAKLARNGAVVRYVDMENLTGGIIHTKLWVVDGRHVYIGSANMDWRSLTQVKELGVVISNCSCLAHDMKRIFQMYSYLGEKEAMIPAKWPRQYSARSSMGHPLKLKLNGTDADVYVSSSPSLLCSEGRTSDLDAILGVIDDAAEFVHISVMEFLPLCQHCQPKRFWPAIDQRLRAAACERHVAVRLLVSCWQHSYQPMFVFLESLSVLNKKPLHCDIVVKVFHIHSTDEEKQIPFARVNHNKYMVTDQVAYIGTSNWSEDYFIRTAGVGLIVNQTGAAERQVTVQRQLQAVFERDWNSQHAKLLGEESRQICPKFH
nr:PREDICTED: phospholipase D3-like isoform X2 [Latimeria chalumnae]|eukprot:XP_014354374.1 PREDICTED: phospholipase D3-like isoform X2 [Latimeria chalumnae]